MNNILSFLHRAFPTDKRTVFAGLGAGVLLFAINWYPFPILIESMHLPKEAVYAVILVLLVILLVRLLKGKVSMRRRDTLGWFAIGYFGLGTFLASLPLGNAINIYGGASTFLIAGVLFLAAYLIFVKTYQEP